MLKNAIMTRVMERYKLGMSSYLCILDVPDLKLVITKSAVVVDICFTKALKNSLASNTDSGTSMWR